jgi:hypothetical protein
MLRISIAIAALTLFVNASLACVSCKGTRGTGQKSIQCHTLVGSKNLKGDAYKSEWSKCIENPDNYK